MQRKWTKESEICHWDCHKGALDHASTRSSLHHSSLGPVHPDISKSPFSNRDMATAYGAQGQAHSRPRHPVDPPPSSVRSRARTHTSTSRLLLASLAIVTAKSWGLSHHADEGSSKGDGAALIVVGYWGWRTWDELQDRWRDRKGKRRAGFNAPRWEVSLSPRKTPHDKLRQIRSSAERFSKAQGQ